MATPDLRAVALPQLTPEEVADVVRCANPPLEHYSDGQVLVRAGARETRFFLVSSGELAVLDEAGEEPKTIALLGPGELTGEVTALMGACALVTVVARRNTEVYALDATSMRDIINRSPAL